MKKILVVCALYVMLVNGGIGAEKTEQGNDSCHILDDTSIVCERDIPDGCVWDEQIRDIVCFPEPYLDNCLICVKK